MDFTGNDFLIVVGVVGILFALRYVNLWYWKIDESLKIQQEQLELMRKLVDSNTVKWECPECKHQNPNSTYSCEECDYSMR